MITLGPTLAAVSPVEINVDAAGAAAADAAVEFGNLLQSLMGASPSAGVDVPLDYQDDDAGEEVDLDELVNANVIDPSAQPIIRLLPAWIAVDALVTPANAVVEMTETQVAARAISAAAMRGALAAAIDARPGPAAIPATSSTDLPAPPSADLPTPPSIDPPAPESSDVTALATGRAAPALDGVMAEAGATPDKSPIADAPAAATPLAEAPTRSTPNALALPQPTEGPTSTLPAAVSQNASVVPIPESAPRDAAPAATAPRRGAEKQDPVRQPSPTAVEAGQRAYAAASEDAKKDTHNGYGEGRHDGRANIEALPATPSVSAAAPFQVVVDRPSLPAASPLVASVMVAPEVVAAAAAAELPAQLVQSIRMQAIGGGGEAIVKLNPEYLGELVVAIKVENGAVTAALQSDVPAVRKWVENNEGTLRQALAEHGLQLERLTITEEAPASETGDDARRDQHQHEEEPRPRRQRKAAPDATFEVIV